MTLLGLTAANAHASSDLSSVLESFEFVDAGIRVTIDLDELRHVFRTEISKQTGIPATDRVLALATLDFKTTAASNQVEFTFRTSISGAAWLTARGRLELTVAESQRLNIDISVEQPGYEHPWVFVTLKEPVLRLRIGAFALPTFGLPDLRFDAIRFIRIDTKEAVADLVVAAPGGGAP